VITRIPPNEAEGASEGAELTPVLVSTAIQALTSSHFRSAFTLSDLLNRIGFNLEAKFSAVHCGGVLFASFALFWSHLGLLTFSGLSSMALIQDTSSNFIAFYYNIT
jgi:hypothetical protein